MERFRELPPIQTLFDAMAVPLAVPKSTAVFPPVPRLDPGLFSWLKLDE